MPCSPVVVVCIASAPCPPPAFAAVCRPFAVCPLSRCPLSRPPQPVRSPLGRRSSKKRSLCPCPPTATPALTNRSEEGDGKGDTVVPTRRRAPRAVESGAGTHTRGGTRGPRAAVHPRKSHLPSECVGQPFAGSLPECDAHPDNQKKVTKTNRGADPVGFGRPSRTAGAFRAAESREGY